MNPPSQVIYLIERLVALPDFTADAIGGVLSVTLAPDPSVTNPFFHNYVAHPATLVFSLVEFRDPIPGSAAPGADRILTLTAHREPPVTRHDLAPRFGPVPPSQIIPEGLISYTYTLGHFQVHLTFLSVGEVLHHVVLTTRGPA